MTMTASRILIGGVLWAVTLGACANEVGSDGASAEPYVANIAKGAISAGARGVINFSLLEGGNFEENCTGVMIGPRHALTAAHCVGNAHQGTPFVTFNRTVFYHAPSGGRFASRIQEELKAEILPSWAGLGQDYYLDPDSDLALVTREEPWMDTDASDYVDLFAGRFEKVRDVWSGLFGAGYDSNAKTGAGILRVMPLDIHHGSGEFMFFADGEDASSCDGDSGGPAMTAWNDGHNVVFGILSGVPAATRVCGDSESGSAFTKINARASWIADRVPNCSHVDEDRVRCL